MDPSNRKVFASISRMRLSFTSLGVLCLLSFRYCFDCWLANPVQVCREVLDEVLSHRMSYQGVKVALTPLRAQHHQRTCTCACL